MGNFFRSMNSISMRSLAAAMEFWSQGTKQALFLEHEARRAPFARSLHSQFARGDCTTVTDIYILVLVSYE